MTDVTTLMRAVSGCAVAAIVGGWAVIAQERDTLFTEVTAEGNVVSVSWDKKHPWDAQLSKQGAELLVEYAVARGAVAESLGTMVPTKGQRTLKFTLPESVKGEPAGQVCLYVRPVGGAVLPVRRANEKGTDTSRFRYEPWEQRVRSRAGAIAAKARVDAATRDAEGARQRVTAQNAVLAQRGWTAAGACDAIPLTRTALPPRPYDVVAPGDQDLAARRVCVHRVWVGRLATEDYLDDLTATFTKPNAARDVARARGALRAIFEDAFLVPEAAGPIAEQLRGLVGAAGMGNRAVQATEFQADWKRLSGDMAKYEPQLGQPTDVLNWTATAREAAFLVLGRNYAKQVGAEWAMEGVALPTQRDLSGLVGAALDAYFGCIEDGRKQLKIKYDAWQTLEADAKSGERDRQRHDFIVRECRQEVDKRNTLQGDLDRLQAQLARDQEVLTPLAAQAPLPARAQQLNFAACDQK